MSTTKLSAIFHMLPHLTYDSLQHTFSSYAISFYLWDKPADFCLWTATKGRWRFLSDNLSGNDFPYRQVYHSGGFFTSSFFHKIKTCHKVKTVFSCKSCNWVSWMANYTMPVLFCAICRPSGFDIPFCSLIFAIKHIYTLLQNSYNMSIL